MEKTKKREIELLQLGFKKNEHQRCFHQWKYNSSWTFDFWTIEEFSDNRWNMSIEKYKKYLKEAKIELKQDELYVLGFNFAQKEFKKEIKDKYNHYNSKLKEATKTKLDRRDRTEYIIKLEAKVEILKSMME